MAVVTGEQAGFTGGYNMIAHNITTFETCDVSQFAFTAFSRVAAGHKVNSSIWRDISGKKLNLGVCKKHCLHASCAQQTLTKYTVHLGHTLVLKISVGCRHCCFAKMDELSRSFCVQTPNAAENKSRIRLVVTIRSIQSNKNRFR